MERRWGFLAPWCTALKDRLVYRILSCENIAWDVERRHLQVYVPGREDRVDHGEEESPRQYLTEAAYKAHFLKVQEALLLLAAVKHVDHTAFRYLLKHSGVNFGQEGEEKFEEEVPARFVLHIDLEEVKTEDSDLVQFCQLKDPSEEFRKALQKISERMDGKLQPKHVATVSIQVPVRVYVSDRFHQPLAALAAAHKAEQVIQEHRKQQKQDAFGGPLQPTFVLEPMAADLECVPITAEQADTLDALIRDNMRFSRVVLNTDPDDDAEALATDDETWRLALAKLMTRVFDSTRRDLKPGSSQYFLPQDAPPTTQIQSVMLSCEGSDEIFPKLTSVCSAIAVSQTVSALTLELTVSPDDAAASARVWKWMAYGFFSKRARQYSALQSLGISPTARCSMRRADIEAFRSVMLSDYPEEELFGYPRGSVESRGATLATGASFRWYYDDVARSTEFRLLSFDSPVRFVRTFSDDGESEWVNVVIPGYGRCEARRLDLNFVENCVPDLAPPTLMSLQLPVYSRNSGFGDGLPLLLATVGPMLKSLSLDGLELNARDSVFLELSINNTVFLGDHPHLKELSLRSRGVEARLDFKEYDCSRQELAALRCDCTDVTSFVKSIATDVSNPFGRCISRLRVRLNDIFNWYGEVVVDNTVEALLDVLECNQSIGFFDIVAPPDFHNLAAAFRAFHLKTLPKPLHPLPIECKVAFLSVMATTQPSQKRTCNSQASGKKSLCQLNEHVLSKIFGFAAPPVIRKVYFRKAQEDDWDDDDAEVSL